MGASPEGRRDPGRGRACQSPPAKAPAARAKAGLDTMSGT